MAPRSAPQAPVDDALAAIPRLLNECQLSCAVHVRAAKTLGALRRAHPEAFSQRLTPCIQSLLLVPKGAPEADRVAKFLAVLATRQDADASADEQEEAEEFLEKLLAFLVSHTTVRNKHVRYRACQLVAEILERLTEEISEDLWDELKVALLARLRDKMVPVRMQAARALSRLQEPVEEGSDISSDPVVTAYIQSLSWERSKDVRKVVLGSLVVADGTLSAVVDRTCDSHAEVRRVVFMVLAAKAELCHLSIVQRNSILRCGFADRDPKARQACMDLLVTWFRACNSDPVELLHKLDVESNADVCEMVVDELIGASLIKPVEVANSRAAEGLRRDLDHVSLLDAGSAFFWRKVCGDLRTKAAAQGGSAAAACGTVAAVASAVASDHLDALENALPPTATEFFALVRAHVHDGEASRFAAQQLLQLVPCLDLADGVGHHAAISLVQELLRQPPGPGSYACGGDESLERAVVSAAKHVHADDRQLQQALLEAALHMWKSATPADDVEPQSQSCPEDALVWRQSLLLILLMLESMPKPGDRGSTHLAKEDIVQVLEEMVLPAVQHSTAAVRVDGLRCLGLFLLIGDLEASYVSILRAALAHDTPACQAAACRALFDLALCIGPARVDAGLHAPTPAGSVADQLPLIKALAANLDCAPAVDATDEETNLRSLAIQGLAKLLIFERMGEEGSGQSEQVLAQLLAMYFELDESAEPQAAQCLSVFFPTFARATGQHRFERLGRAALLALRQTAGTKILSRLTPYLLHLLQLSVAGSGSGVQTARLMLSLLTEAHVASNSIVKRGVVKPYMSACCKLAAGLPMPVAPHDEQDVLLKQAIYVLQQIQETVTDKLLQKELAGLMGKINESASVANLVLTDEELLALAAEAQFCLNDHELLSGCFGLAHQEGSSPIQEKRVSLARKSKATKAHQATPTFEHEGDGYDSSTDEDSDAEGTQEEEKTSRKVLVDKNSEHVTSPAASSKNTRLRTRSTALV